MKDIKPSDKLQPSFETGTTSRKGPNRAEKLATHFYLLNRSDGRCPPIAKSDGSFRQPPPRRLDSLQQDTYNHSKGDQEVDRRKTDKPSASTLSEKPEDFQKRLTTGSESSEINEITDQMDKSRIISDDIYVEIGKEINTKIEKTVIDKYYKGNINEKIIIPEDVASMIIDVADTNIDKTSFITNNDTSSLEYQNNMIRREIANSMLYDDNITKSITTRILNRLQRSNLIDHSIDTIDYTNKVLISIREVLNAREEMSNYIQTDTS